MGQFYTTMRNQEWIFWLTTVDEFGINITYDMENSGAILAEIKHKSLFDFPLNSLWKPYPNEWV